MKAKDKAIELVDKFKHLVHIGGEIDTTIDERELDNAKDAALICVDEIMEVLIFVTDYHEEGNCSQGFWEEVKQNIQKL